MNDQTYFLRTSSPLGEILLLGSDLGLSGVYLATQGFQPGPATLPGVGHPVLSQASDELRDYFAGTLRRFSVPLRAHGTPFQERVWAALCEVPFGATTSYGALAARLGQPGAARAVGAANGKNPLSIIVPCHRVIGGDGSLRGYAGGEPSKRWLLHHESALLLDVNFGLLAGRSALASTI